MFFFFFLRIQIQKSSLFHKRTKITKPHESLKELYHQDRNQSKPVGCSALQELAFLAKKWVTKLPMRFTWEKLQLRKPLERNRISLITLPYSRFPQSPVRTALMIISTSSQNCTKKYSILLQKSKLFYRPKPRPQLGM